MIEFDRSGIGHPAAVIFDFDGTLVDTMPLHYEAYKAAFATFGLELPRERFFANIGGTARETIVKFIGDQPCTVSVAELHGRKKELVQHMFATLDVPVLETAKLLPLLAAHYPLALASSGSRAGIEVILTRLGWQKYFRAVVTGEDVVQGKPAPDAFLLAAKLLGAAPGACFVFEDTDAGVTAASNAGMRVFDVRATISATS
jgi:beta-phosphoglucomutase family hydrolase